MIGCMFLKIDRLSVVFRVMGGVGSTKSHEGFGLHLLLPMCGEVEQQIQHHVLDDDLDHKQGDKARDIHNTACLTKFKFSYSGQHLRAIICMSSDRHKIAGRRL
ncbi:unnamed protein product [Boreogadus saida]